MDRAARLRLTRDIISIISGIVIMLYAACLGMVLLVEWLRVFTPSRRGWERYKTLGDSLLPYRIARHYAFVPVYLWRYALSGIVLNTAHRLVDLFFWVDQTLGTGSTIFFILVLLSWLVVLLRIAVVAPLRRAFGSETTPGGAAARDKRE